MTVTAHLTVNSNTVWVRTLWVPSRVLRQHGWNGTKLI